MIRIRRRTKTIVFHNMSYDYGMIEVCISLQAQRFIDLQHHESTKLVP